MTPEQRRDGATFAPGTKHWHRVNDGPGMKGYERTQPQRDPYPYGAVSQAILDAKLCNDDRDAQRQGDHYTVVECVEEACGSPRIQPAWIRAI